MRACVFHVCATSRCVGSFATGHQSILHSGLSCALICALVIEVANCGLLGLPFAQGGCVSTQHLWLICRVADRGDGGFVSVITHARHRAGTVGAISCLWFKGRRTAARSACVLFGVSSPCPPLLTMALHPFPAAYSCSCLCCAGQAHQYM